MLQSIIIRSIIYVLSVYFRICRLWFTVHHYLFVKVYGRDIKSTIWLGYSPSLCVLSGSSVFFVIYYEFEGGTALASITIGQPIRFLTSDKLVVALLMAWYFCNKLLLLGLLSSALHLIWVWRFFNFALSAYFINPMVIRSFVSFSNCWALLFPSLHMV